MQTQKQVVDALLTPDAYPQDPGQNRTHPNAHILCFLNQKLRLQSKKSRKLWVFRFLHARKKTYSSAKKSWNSTGVYAQTSTLKSFPSTNQKRIKINGNGETIEYALKMKRLPQERIMTVLLKENKVDKKTIDEIARDSCGVPLESTNKP